MPRDISKRIKTYVHTMNRGARAGYSLWIRKESDTTVRLTFFHTKTGTQMFIALFIIKKKNRKQPKCPSTHGQIHKMWWYTHTIEYLAMKGIKYQYMSKHRRTLETRSERSHSWKATNCRIYLHKKSRADKSAVIEGRQRKPVTANVCEISLRAMKLF